MFRRARQQPKRTHWFLDILDLLLTHELVLSCQLIADGIVHGARNTDTPGFGQTLQPCGDIHPVTIDIAPVLDHVTQVQTDAKLESSILGRLLAPSLQVFLNGGGAVDGVSHRVEHGEHRVARVVHDPATVAPDDSGDDVQILAELTVGGILVLSCQARVSSDICVQYRGELAGESLGILH